MIELIETGLSAGTHATVIGGRTPVEIVPLPPRTRAAYRVFLNSIHSKQDYRWVSSHTRGACYAVRRAGKIDRLVALYADAVRLAVRYAAKATT
jgi:hypothetical protein